jgi:hypothetical protein
MSGAAKKVIWIVSGLAIIATLIVSVSRIGRSTGNTWYVNAAGGSRYSVNNTNGQCDGTNPQSYAAAGGTGTNLHCAFNDIRSLWTDGTYTTDVNAGAPKWGWVGSAGDTYLIDCKGMTGDSCRVGQSGPNGSDSYGLNGDPFQSGAPFPPAGTASQHTRILGINYANCSSPSAKTVVNGGYGTNWVFTTNSYVDIQCFEITDHTSCNKASSLTTNPCSTSYPLSDYTTEGLQFFNSFTNVNIQDVYIHGTAHDCIAGATGDATVLTNVSASGCPHSTFNMDPGNGTTGSGALTLNNVNMAFAGFAEVYPIVPANNFTLPWGSVGQVGDGTDQSHGGYGDCMGTTTVESNPPWIITINGGGCQYASQDGHDFLHVTGNGSRVIINGVIDFGNMGQQIKLGSSGSVTNSLIVGNCNAPGHMPGLAPGGAAQLSDFCRASDTALYVAVSNGSHTDIRYNTIYTAGVIAVGVTNQASPACSDATCVLNFDDNVIVGFPNTVANGYTSAQATGKSPNPMYVDAISPYPYGGSTYDHNATYGQLATAPCPNGLYGETNALCTSPQLTDMTWHIYGYGNMAPASPSAVVGAGIAIPGITTDYFGHLRPTPPTMGAIEGGTSPTVTTFTVTPNPGAVAMPATLAMTCTAKYSDNSTEPCTGPTWQDTGAHSTVSATGVVTGVSAGSDTITATNGTISGTSTVNISAPPPPPAATPTALPLPGTYTSTQSVSLATTTSGAKICPTTDGTTPAATTPGTCNGPTYTGPIPVAISTTIKALTTMAGHTNSPIASFLYNINSNPITIVLGGVSITPAPGVTLTKLNVINGHVAFTATTSQTTTQIATVLFKNNKLNYVSCGVIANGETILNGLTWSAAGTNTLSVTVQNALQPSGYVNVHIDCWTA